MDDQVDKMNEEANYSLSLLIKDQPALTAQALNALVISRNLERVADHATNIAEDVIFWVRGADVRHHQSQSQKCCILVANRIRYAADPPVEPRQHGMVDRQAVSALPGGLIQFRKFAKEFAVRFQLAAYSSRCTGSEEAVASCTFRKRSSLVVDDPQILSAGCARRRPPKKTRSGR